MLYDKVAPFMKQLRKRESFSRLALRFAVLTAATPEAERVFIGSAGTMKASLQQAALDKCASVEQQLLQSSQIGALRSKDVPARDN